MELPAHAPNLQPPLLPTDPTTSPCGHLLSAAQRGDLAAELNKAILAMKGKREDSALECVYKQASQG